MFDHILGNDTMCKNVLCCVRTSDDYHRIITSICSLIENVTGLTNRTPLERYCPGASGLKHGGIRVSRLHNIGHSTPKVVPLFISFWFTHTVDLDPYIFHLSIFGSDIRYAVSKRALRCIFAYWFVFLYLLCYEHDD